jgi:hypothetical protein
MLNLIRASLGILPDSTFPENALATFRRKIRRGFADARICGKPEICKVGRIFGLMPIPLD